MMTATRRRAGSTLRRTLTIAALAAAWTAGLAASGDAGAQQYGLKVGPSGLPLPRFVSLKSDKVNVRAGPGRTHKVKWVFTKVAIPVEIVSEFDNWRRIRFADGTEGWVFHALLSSTRTALVRPWREDELVEARSGPEATSPITARLEPMVIARVDACEREWCDVRGRGWQGYVRKEELWGVYPDEILD